MTLISPLQDSFAQGHSLLRAHTAMYMYLKSFTNSPAVRNSNKYRMPSFLCFAKFLHLSDPDLTPQMPCFLPLPLHADMICNVIS